MRNRTGSLSLLFALATLFTLVSVEPASDGQLTAPCELKDDAAYTAATRQRLPRGLPETLNALAPHWQT